MNVKQLKNFLQTCAPNSEVGITVFTKEGSQFWQMDGNDLAVFKAPDGQKCISLIDARKNEPFPYGAIIRSNSLTFDDVPTSPKAILTELESRFDITPKTQGRKVEELSEDELTDIMFETIHKEIGDLIRLNNNLLVYVKNKFKKQKQYWIDVQEREENE